MGPQTTPRRRTATTTTVAQAPKLFNIKRTAPVRTKERVLAGTLKDYILDADVISLSDNVHFPVMDIKKDDAVTLKIEWDGEIDYGLLWFSRPISAKLRNKVIKVEDMLDYPIQEQPIFMDSDEQEPLLDENGKQVVKYIISKPDNEGRVVIKKPVAGEGSKKPKVSDVW